jgi:hypothetical protein
MGNEKLLVFPKGQKFKEFSIAALIAPDGLNLGRELVSFMNFAKQEEKTYKSGTKYLEITLKDGTIWIIEGWGNSFSSAEDRNSHFNPFIQRFNEVFQKYREESLLKEVDHDTKMVF